MEQEQVAGEWITIIVTKLIPRKTKKTFKRYMSVQDEHGIWYNDFVTYTKYIRKERYKIKTEVEGDYRNIVVAKLVDQSELLSTCLVCATMMLKSGEGKAMADKELKAEIVSWMKYFTWFLVPGNINKEK